MSQLIKNYNKKLTSSSLLTLTIASTKTTSISSLAEIFSARAEVFTQHKDSTFKSTSTTKRNLSSASLLAPEAVEAATLNAEVASDSLASMTKQQLVDLTQITSASSSSSATERKVWRTMPSFKIMSSQNIIALLTVLVCGFVTVNGLKCYMCGQYNEGVGSITPCLNYSEQYAHLYLKECSKKSEKYCVKYVSELSIVRDCATECAEKEIWETQTYCCTEDGCNGSSAIETSVFVLMLPLIIYIVHEIMNIIKQQRR